MKKNRIKNNATALIMTLIMLSSREKRKRERLRRNDIVQEVIDSGHPAHVRYISPLPRGDGKIHSCKGRVVVQNNLYLFVKRPRSGEIRILKSRMFLMTTQEKQRPRKSKDPENASHEGLIKFQKEK